MIEKASLSYESIDSGSVVRIEIDPIARFQMKGIGYGHPTWRHGNWHGGDVVGAERWNAADLDINALENQHVQHVVRATVGDEHGFGALEQATIGPYRPYGLQGLIDPPTPHRP